MAEKTFAQIMKIAKTCHEVNRSYCEATGDKSQLSWDDAPSWQRDSAINGVKFHLAKPNSKPSDSHDNWMKEKQKDGWVYGEIKNEDERTHPCMVEYDKLPTIQKVKDYLFLTIVRCMEND